MSRRPEKGVSSLVRLVAFLSVTMTLTAFMAVQIARLDFSGSYTVTATFDDVSGLMEGDQVKIAGAPVGQVEAIRVRDGRAEVRLAVREGHRLPSDSEAAIRWRNPISGRVIYLIPGTSPAPLRDGGTIGRTRSVVDIGELIAQLAPLTRTLDAKQINRLMTSIYQALEGNEREVGQLVTNIDRLSSTIAARRQTLKQTLRDFSTVSEVLARRDKQIAQMTDNLVTLSDAFVDNRKLVDRAVVELAAMVRTTDALAGRNADQLARTIERLGFVMGGTSRNLDRLKPLLESAGPKMARISDIIDEGRFPVGAAPCITLAPGKCPYDTRLNDYPDQGARVPSGPIPGGG
ncbi:MlaD family protein [Actinomadura sp. 7K507]|uniref:MCE family protein n=1 Tax=Actinomadura sp. 7K507 TaxID=2530365 RepID=UPI0010521B38|nr:MlaD family protein [Actinomadura sp. 7K507]TDC97933.1 MCE family protein [Actinomadura sp. 7K507]